MSDNPTLESDSSDSSDNQGSSVHVHLAMCILLCASCCASYDLGIPSSPIRCPIGYPGRLSQRPSTSTSTTFASLIEHIRNGEEKKNLQLEHTKVKWQTLRADGNLRCRLHRARSALRYGPEREAPENGPAREAPENGPELARSALPCPVIRVSCTTI